MSTIVDVARQAGVAPSIVSRLLNDDPTLRIRDETRARVLAAVAALDYAPNHSARSLRRSRAGTLGLAVPDMHNPVYAAILEGARPEAARHGFVLVLTDTEDLAADTAPFRQIVHGGSIDGLMLQRDTAGASRVVERVAPSRLPVVILNERVRPPAAGVAVDDRAAAALATRHLLELGHTRIAHLRVRGRNSRSRDREAGWRDALRAWGIEPDERLVGNGGATPEAGYRGLTDLLAAGSGRVATAAAGRRAAGRGTTGTGATGKLAAGKGATSRGTTGSGGRSARRSRPTAVFVGSVLAAVGALAAARDAGLSVPEDLSVVAYHDTWLASYVDPPLTVVRLPLAAMGREAVEVLVDLIDGRPARQVLLDDPAPELVVRSSTAPPA